MHLICTEKGSVLQQVELSLSLDSHFPGIPLWKSPGPNNALITPLATSTTPTLPRPLSPRHNYPVPVFSPISWAIFFAPQQQSCHRPDLAWLFFYTNTARQLSLRTFLLPSRLTLYGPSNVKAQTVTQPRVVYSTLKWVILNYFVFLSYKMEIFRKINFETK